MKRFEPKKKKIDLIFISVTIIAIVLVAVLSWFFQDSNQTMLILVFLNCQILHRKFWQAGYK